MKNKSTFKAWEVKRIWTGDWQREGRRNGADGVGAGGGAGEAG